jgi:hypothetical protein
LIQGAGTISANVQSSGTIGTGTSPATLSINGDLMLQNGAKSVFKLAGAQPGMGYDHFAINGNLTLGGSLDLSFSNGYEALIHRADSFDLLTITGAISGALDIPSGSRVFTSDGIGSFLLSYPAESDDKSVVLSDYLARGDFDGDGIVTTTDVNIMLQALTNSSQFAAAASLSADELNAVGDVDGSGNFDNLDIQALISRTLNVGHFSGNTPQTVPEPPSLVLATFLFLALILPRIKQSKR